MNNGCMVVIKAAPESEFSKMTQSCLFWLSAKVIIMDSGGGSSDCVWFTGCRAEHNDPGGIKTQVIHCNDLPHFYLLI